MTDLRRESSTRVFGGSLHRFRHRSRMLDCEMNFSVYLPPAAEHGAVPVLYWLSGLTCTDENFMIKAGAQRGASQLGMALVSCDTSPRGAEVADDESYDLGTGAGFYVNATQDPWRRHYRMYDYVVQELPALAESELPLDGKRRAISGHSMGGHGALVIALRNPGAYRSVSAFAPIASPMRCPWGEKALGTYLGDDRESWREWDTTELLGEATDSLSLLVDQGSADGFLEEQLKPSLLEQAARQAGVPLQLNMREGYDHSYYFIATFIDEHLKWHAGACGD